MKFKAADLRTFKGYKETKIQKLLNDFVASNIAVAEVFFEVGEYKNTTSAYSAVNGAIKRFKMQNISARVVNKKLYLINQVLYAEALKSIKTEV